MHNSLLNNQIMNDLVGEIVDEKIELLDNIPSYEEVYGKSVAEGIITRLKNGGALADGSRSDIVKNDINISCKMLLVFNDEPTASELINSKGKTLKLPNTWKYSSAGGTRVIIEFVIK